ncbi:hypothetical protein HYZ97_03770 [Candidatus Pacearchaeota archaeon]|nr:hypothetical protein [Candidatus Pacearchaeota archaeon]
MNKQGLEIVGWIIVGVVVVIVLLGAYAVLKGGGPFRFIPTFNTTQPHVEGDAIVRYSIGTNSVEYYDGVQWHAFKGAQILGAHTVEPNVLLNDFILYWYQEREGSRTVAGAGQIQDLVQGRSSDRYAGIAADESVRGYMKVYYNGQPPQNYLVNYNNELYILNNGADLNEVQTVTLSVQDTGYLILNQVDHTQLAYAQSDVREHVLAFGALIKELNKQNDPLLQKMDKIVVLSDSYSLLRIGDLPNSKGIVRYQLYSQGKGQEIYLVLAVEAPTPFGGIYYITGGHVEVELDFKNEYMRKKLLNSIESELVKGSVQWRDQIKTKPAFLLGENYCLTYITPEGVLVAYLDTPATAGTCI